MEPLKQEAAARVVNVRDIEPQILLERARLVADWIIRNQVTDRQDANKGRSIRSYDAMTKEKILTGNWMCGNIANTMCAMYKRTGEEQYLNSAELAGHYLMSLQAMDQRSKYYGAIRELTPQSIEFAPRDAVGAAWGLVWLAETSGKSEYLDRAVLFADWLIEKGMYQGWPMYAIYMDDQLEDFYSRGHFHSGTGLFLYDLFRLTGEQRYIDKGLLPIATIYRDHFIKDDGFLVKEIDPFTGKVTDPKSEFETPTYAINDDFGALMMIAASRLFGDPSYAEKAGLYARWIASLQQQDGGFFGERIPSGVPVSAMTFADLGEILKDEPLKHAARKSLRKLLTMQFVESEDPCILGGFRGIYEGIQPNREGRLCVNMRTSGYALIALLKAESTLSTIWLGLHNDPFRDQRWIAPHNLIW